MMRGLLACLWLVAAAAAATAGNVAASEQGVVAADAPHRVFIAGDSTASAYGPERAPRTGWGQVLGDYLADGWEVRNHAQSGRSARSFIAQGWQRAIEDGLRPGDVLLIQFGHNDAKVEDPARYNEPTTAYPEWLMRHVRIAREHGATPVLVTPVARRKFDHGQLLDTHGAYPGAMRALAVREGIALVDLTASSMAWLRATGDEASRPYYMHDNGQGPPDDTHFSDLGARVVACLVAAGWREAQADAPVRAPDAAGCADVARPAPAPPPSPSVVVNERDIATAQPGPHEGEGTTTAYPFFADATGFDLVFRKRALHPGATIGHHVNDKDEIYYVLSGRGRLTLEGEVREVGAGDAILTRSGDSHALAQVGAEDLVIFIVFDEASRSR